MCGLLIGGGGGRLTLARLLLTTALSQRKFGAFMNSGRVTIQDLADRLGLSKFSVSRALSGKPGVGKATRDRVLRAAHSMGYRVSEEFSQSNGQVLFIRQEVDPVSSELWLNVLHGAEMEGERRGLSVVPRQARYLSDPSSIDSTVVGIILAVPYPAELSGLAAKIGLPVVCAGYVGALERVDHVVGTDWEAGVAVGRFLMAHGHREIAFVHGNSRLLGRAERFRGLRDAVLDVEDAKVDDIVFDESVGFRSAFLSHLQAGGAPTALFCAHDGIAVNVISELARLDVRVPDDISVVGFNDFISASQVVPRLTSVRTPQMEMGAAMMRCIADRALNPDFRSVPPMRIALVSEIIERESTGPAKQSAWRSRCLAGVG